MNINTIIILATLLVEQSFTTRVSAANKTREKVFNNGDSKAETLCVALKEESAITKLEITYEQFIGPLVSGKIVRVENRSLRTITATIKAVDLTGPTSNNGMRPVMKRTLTVGPGQNVLVFTLTGLNAMTSVWLADARFLN